MKATFEKNALVFLLLFLGLGALGGGALLIISPSGKLLGDLPLSLLARSPFPDFRIPGLLLFVVLGLFPCLLAVVLIQKPANRFAEHFNFFTDMYWGWTYTIYVAFSLIIWIQVEPFIVQRVGWLQIFYMLYTPATLYCPVAANPNTL